MEAQLLKIWSANPVVKVQCRPWHPWFGPSGQIGAYHVIGLVVAMRDVSLFLGTLLVNIPILLLFVARQLQEYHRWSKAICCWTKEKFFASVPHTGAGATFPRTGQGKPTWGKKFPCIVVDLQLCCVMPCHVIFPFWIHLRQDCSKPYGLLTHASCSHAAFEALSFWFWHVEFISLWNPIYQIICRRDNFQETHTLLWNSAVPGYSG